MQQQMPRQLQMQPNQQEMPEQFGEEEGISPEEKFQKAVQAYPKESTQAFPRKPQAELPEGRQRGIKSLDDRLAELKQNPSFQRAPITIKNQMRVDAKAQHKADIEEADLDLKRREGLRREEEKNEKVRQFEVKRADKRIEPYVKKINSIRDALPKREMALNSMKRASVSGEIGPFSQSHLADLIGHPELGGMNSTLFNSGVKDYFKEDLMATGARPNMFLEQKFYSALPMIGQDQSAQMQLIDGYEYINNRSKEEMKLFDQLSSADEAKYGHIHPNIQLRVKKELDNWDEVNQPKYNLQMQEHAEMNKKFKHLKFLSKQPLPTPLTERQKMAIIDVAVKDLLRRNNGVKPNKLEVAELASNLMKKNNYYIVEE
jgi:hypothetical protein